MKTMHTIGSELLPTIAYGDAAGLPYEAADPQPEHSVQGLADTTRNPYIGQWPAGTWSDDTHLSLAVARSLIEADGFDLESQARWHVDALNQIEGHGGHEDIRPAIVNENGHTGWGKGTLKSVRSLREGVPPTESGQPTAGNGVLMKLGPLAYWQLARSTDQTTGESEVVQLTDMTHRLPEATVASLVHVAHLKDMSKGEVSLCSAARYARHYERQFGAKPILGNLLGYLALAEADGTLSRSTILNMTPKKGFYAPETLVMAYGSFALEPKAPASIYRAVELGGDSDSVGSIVATMSLFGGMGERPADYGQLFDVPRLEQVSRTLAQTALK